MVLFRKYGIRILLIIVSTTLLGTMLCLTCELSAQEDPTTQVGPTKESPTNQENPPIGVYVERLIPEEASDVIEKCKYCGRFIKIGDIHRDAETVVGNLVMEGLNDRKIPYEEGKEQNRYLHVYIYRYEERRGGNFSVEKPAGAAFHMHLFDHGTIKRIFVFDEDQRPLLDNIFKIGQFIRRGMKWITVDKLAEEGIEKGLDTLSEDLK